jgi:hypothetical protein
MTGSVELRKPKNWQDFELAVRELFACVLEDPNTAMHGRTFQAQHGVDVYGRRKSTGNQWVGAQCKRSADPITESELQAELAKAKKFTPPISEFHLVTTAARDQAIQNVARLLTERLASSNRPIEVRVWGWQDIEEEASKHAAALKAFDPTWNPYAEQSRDELLQKMDSLTKSPAAPEPVDHDRELMRAFRQLVTPQLLQYLWDHDFGAPTRFKTLEPLETLFEWKTQGARQQFNEPILQNALEKVFTANDEFSDVVSSRLFAMNNPELGSPKTNQDKLHGLSQSTREGIRQMNDLARALWHAIDDLERVAKQKNK